MIIQECCSNESLRVLNLSQKRVCMYRQMSTDVFVLEAEGRIKKAELKIVFVSKFWVESLAAEVLKSRRIFYFS